MPRRPPQTASRAVAAKPAPEARVPLPQARPAAIEPARQRAAKPAGGFALASATSMPFSLPSRTVPRPPAEVSEPTDLSASRAETTASITSWLNDAEFGRTDRVPPGDGACLCGNAAPESQRPVALTPPMGAARLRRRRPRPRRSPASRRKAGQRYNDPWMRGITLATSVHYEMNVTVYGRLDVRQVRMMMIKPVDEPRDGASAPTRMTACRR